MKGTTALCLLFFLLLLLIPLVALGAKTPGKGHNASSAPP
ncbi:MAG TPA: stage II sporulation protein D, partial [Ruminococcaceae bacterium]|nr:stage II sporulation protein D [Oscillospiraceae bacterium]